MLPQTSILHFVLVFAIQLQRVFAIHAVVRESAKGAVSCDFPFGADHLVQLWMDSDRCTCREDFPELKERQQSKEPSEIAEASPEEQARAIRSSAFSPEEQAPLAEDLLEELEWGRKDMRQHHCGHAAFLFQLLELSGGEAFE